MLLGKTSIWYIYTGYRDIYALHLLRNSPSAYSIQTSHQITTIRQNRNATPTPKTRPIKPMLSPKV